MSQTAIPIQIPRINDNPWDYATLFRIWQRVEKVDKPKLEFNFHNCDFLQQNAVAFIGSLVRYAQYKGGVVYFDMDSFQDKVRINLEQNGFLYKLDLRETYWQGNSIPYREDYLYKHNDFTDYLSYNWLGRGWVNISDSLKTHITQPVIEAYINVFDHANSPFGVITCGQHYPNKQLLKLALVDFGIGIPKSVRDYLESHTCRLQMPCVGLFNQEKAPKHKAV